MKQAVDCELFLYAHDSCLVHQLKGVKETERNLNKNFRDVCDWFVDNKLSIHLGEKTKQTVYYLAKNRLNKVSSLDIEYGEMHIKQYHTVIYVGCSLDETLSGESMALKVVNKINSRLRFPYRKDIFMSSSFRRLLCNFPIHTRFDYSCSAWCSNSNNRSTSKLQILQNKFIRFCLNLNYRVHVRKNKLGNIN